MSKWYVEKTGNHQRLIVDEETGANIAVSYEAENAPMLAAAPELLEALELMVKSHAPTINGLCKICHHYGDDCEANIARRAIAKAKGVE